MSSPLTRLRNLATPEITIDEAIAICNKLVVRYPKLAKVAKRIEQLRKERDLTREVAQAAMSDASWERSDMKKRADKQRRDPDND